ncbi:MAG: glycosyltransferase, partial [Opitutales bacterium]
MPTSVIISTYNNPKWLEKVIWGYQTQTYRDFEMIVADDGSKDDTAALIERMRKESGFKIGHVWQSDDGFRKCSILNKAIAASAGDYLIISDGDCIPRNDFVQVHMHERMPDHFISGGYCKLPTPASEAITKEDIISQNAFNPAWLRANGCPHVPLKLRATG